MFNTTRQRAEETFTHVSGVQSAGKLNNVAGASGLCRLLLGDGFGTIKVVLNGNDGKGCSENCRV